jgi:hypothetical protein
MNIMFYLSGMLEQKMMDEWSKLPVQGRLQFRDWARFKITHVMEDHYDH